MSSEISDLVAQMFSEVKAERTRQAEERVACPMCGVGEGPVRTRRMNTQYADDEMNYVTSCSRCFEEGEEMWAEMWKEYYGGLL